MTILVTGGAGFIGSHIADAYIAQKHSVVIIDNLSSGSESNLNPRAKFQKGDIRDSDFVESVIKTYKPDVINHHAAQISVRNSVDHPREDAEINIIGLLNILVSSARHKVKKVIFASSGGVVYGNASKIPTPDDYPYLNPISPYGVSKLASEHYLSFFHVQTGLSWIALRYSNVYGPRQNPHGEAGVVAIFCSHMIHQRPVVINGDGTQTRDYVFVEDVVLANLLALEARQNGSFNIGTGIETDVNGIFSTLKSISGYAQGPIHGPPKSGEQKRSCLLAKRAKEELGWKSAFSIRQGLKKTYEYFQNHSD